MIFFMEFNDRRAVRSFLTFGNTSHDNIREENTFSFWNEHEVYSLTAFVTSLLHHFDDGYYKQKYVKNWQLGPKSGFFCLTAYNQVSSMRETSTDDLRSKILQIINKNMTQIAKIWPPSLKMKGTYIYV